MLLGSNDDSVCGCARRVQVAREYPDVIAEFDRVYLAHKNLHVNENLNAARGYVKVRVADPGNSWVTFVFRLHNEKRC